LLVGLFLLSGFDEVERSSKWAIADDLAEERKALLREEQDEETAE